MVITDILPETGLEHPVERGKGRGLFFTFLPALVDLVDKLLAHVVFIDLQPLPVDLIEFQLGSRIR